MSEKILNTRIVHKHDTAENWAKATNFIPKQGELIIYDIDNTYTYERFKIGDGKTLVNNLPFADDSVKLWVQNNRVVQPYGVNYENQDDALGITIPSQGTTHFSLYSDGPVSDDSGNFGWEVTLKPTYGPQETYGYKFDLMLNQDEHVATQEWVNAQDFGGEIDTSNFVTLDGAQTISGAKIFTGTHTIQDANPTLDLSGNPAKKVKIYSDSVNIFNSPASDGIAYDTYYRNHSISISKYSAETPQGTYTLTFPDMSGTLALTSDIPVMTNYLDKTSTDAQEIQGTLNLRNNASINIFGSYDIPVVFNRDKIRYLSPDGSLDIYYDFDPNSMFAIVRKGVANTFTELQTFKSGLNTYSAINIWDGESTDAPALQITGTYLRKPEASYYLTIPDETGTLATREYVDEQIAALRDELKAYIDEVILGGEW